MNQKQQIALLVVLLVIGGTIWGWQYWPSSATGAANSSAFLHGYQPLNFPNSKIEWEKIERRRKADYQGSGINPFSTAGPQPPVVPKTPKPGEPGGPPLVPPEPPAPELPANMKFFGYGTVPNGTPRRAFLSYQDDVFIVGEGDTLMGRYRILKINNASLEFEEVGSGRRGLKMLEDQGPAA
jgi:hypothetical protein